MGTFGKILVAVAVSLLSLPAGAASAASKWKDPTPSEKEIVEDPARGLAGAVYLEVSQESVDNVFHVYVRAKILSRNGFEVGTVDDLAEDAFDIEGRTVSATGVVAPLPEREIRTMTTVKAAGVSIRRKGFTLPALEPGSFIEYTYREYGAFGSLGEFHVEVPFQRKFRILRQDLAVPHEFRFPYSGAIRFANGVEIQARPQAGKLVYSAQNAPAIHPEPHGLSKSERSAGVIFSFFFADLHAATAEQYWAAATRLGLAPWVKERLVRPSKVEDRLRKIPGSRAADPLGRLKEVYAYVQTNFKNRDALAAGETPPSGGWKKNADAGDVFSRGSGTPADLVAVFVSLLRADGWSFRVVYCPDLQERVFHPQIPSVYQFDSEVVEVRDPALPRPVYLSFEHPETPFGVVAWNHLATDCYAVDLDKATAEVVQIPQAAPAQNLRRRLWTLTLSSDGGTRIVEESHWTGQQALEARAALFQKGRAQYEKDIRDDYQKLDPPAEVDSVENRNESAPNEEFVTKVTFDQAGLMPASTGRVLFSPLAAIGEANPFTQQTRTEPIRFPYPKLDSDTLQISPPPGYSLEGLPRGYDNSNDVGHYSVSVRQEGDKILVDRIFELRRAAASASAYPLYQSLFETAARGDADLSLVFRRTK